MVWHGTFNAISIIKPQNTVEEMWYLYIHFESKICFMGCIYLRIGSRPSGGDKKKADKEMSRSKNDNSDQRGANSL